MKPDCNGILCFQFLFCRGHGVKEAEVEVDPNGVNLLFFIFYEIILFCFSKSDLTEENITGDVVKVYWLA